LIRAKDGAQIPVRVFEGGDGTPVVMLHGLYSHSGWFTQSAAFIASLGCPVYSFDRRGWGLSSESRGHVGSFRELLDEIDAVVLHATSEHAVGKKAGRACSEGEESPSSISPPQAPVVRRESRRFHSSTKSNSEISLKNTDPTCLHPEGRVHLLGHCLGALPATVFACENPGKIASLILSTPGIYTRVSVPFLRKVQIVALGSLGSKSLIPFPPEPERLADLEIHRRFIATDPLALHKVTASFHFSMFMAAVSLRWKVRRFRVPTFLALAGRDELSDNLRTIAFLNRSPAEKRIVTYPEATHILEYSVEKDRYFADLADWIRRGLPG